MWHVVSSLPGCLASGPSCHSCMISHLRSPLEGMTRCPLESFQKSPIGVCMALIGNISSHCSMSNACSVCTSMTRCSSDLGESVSKTLMKACSGIMVMSWLSSLPSSTPGGLDRVLAVV